MFLLELELDQSYKFLKLDIQGREVAPAVNGHSLVHNKVQPFDLLVGEDRRLTIVMKLVVSHSVLLLLLIMVLVLVLLVVVVRVVVVVLWVLLVVVLMVVVVMMMIVVVIVNIKVAQLQLLLLARGDWLLVASGGADKRVVSVGIISAGGERVEWARRECSAMIIVVDNCCCQAFLVGHCGWRGW